MPNKTVQPIHFEDFDGYQFERLVFAYLLRTDNWLSLEWYGQTGSDSGRDIVGVRERDRYPAGQKVCVQCTNWRTPKYDKIRKDFEKILSTEKPDVFIVVTGGKVSSRLRKKVNKLCEEKEVYINEIWSGNEFEERLRSETETLLKRFIEGDEFPDTPEDLRTFVEEVHPQSDDEILGLMAGLFDRPAFYTPFRYESSIPAFKKAITDTIEALNTGIHRLRDGTEIRRIPSRHAIQSEETKSVLFQIVQILTELRAKFDEFVKTGEIQIMPAMRADISILLTSPNAANEMDRLRKKILDSFRELYPAFRIKLGEYYRY
jgi:hypothetical protein